MKDSTAANYVRLWKKFRQYCRTRDVATLADIDRSFTEEWVWSLIRGGKAPDVATMRLRRSALAKLFEILRQFGATLVDPTLDIELPSRVRPRYRGLTVEEIEFGRSASLATLVETRQPVIWALAEAGATPSEIPSTTASDVDLATGTVWLAGLDSAVPRCARLSVWGRQQLGRHIAGVRDLNASLTYTGAGPIETAQVSTNVALRKLFDRASLSSLEGVAPRSLRITYGLAAYTVNHRVDEAARALGMRSLDQTAALLGIDWALGEA